MIGDELREWIVELLANGLHDHIDNVLLNLLDGNLRRATSLRELVRRAQELASLGEHGSRPPASSERRARNCNGATMGRSFSIDDNKLCALSVGCQASICLILCGHA